VARVVRLERRRLRGVTAAPDVDLLVAVFLRRFGFVQPLQRTVMALVQPPVADHRQPHAVEAVERDPQRADGALEHRGIAAVEVEPLGLQRCGGLVRLGAAGIGQIDVRPAGEAVRTVPFAFAMAQHD